MRLRYLLAVSVIIVSCEKPFVQQDDISGTWEMEITMYENETLIGELKGDILFYADNTAKIITNKNNQPQEVLYEWSLQSDHLLLVNKSTNFTIPYRIHTISEYTILLSQAEGVKMKLFR
ncbi:MAG: hypothetical protein OEX22_10465 [Cyclobacteriaceae bacterium]|nr:hypothetical protein [Cyclobacteriaceae bacterium]